MSITKAAERTITSVSVAAAHLVSCRSLFSTGSSLLHSFCVLDHCCVHLQQQSTAAKDLNLCIRLYTLTGSGGPAREGHRHQQSKLRCIHRSPGERAVGGVASSFCGWHESIEESFCTLTTHMLRQGKQAHNLCPACSLIADPQLGCGCQRRQLRPVLGIHQHGGWNAV